MSPTSTFLQIVVAVMGLLFFLGALITGQILWGFGVLSFFCVAFASLKFSSKDPTAQSPEARKWFLAALISGVIAVSILLITAIVEFANGNSGAATKLLASLALIAYVWHTRGREIKAVITNKSKSG